MKCSIAIGALYCLSWSSSALRPVKRCFRLPTRMPRFAGYIPPELDPEYHNTYPPKNKYTKVTKLTTNRSIASMIPTNATDLTEDSYSFPLPKEGDVVYHSGRWGDRQLGRIRFLRYLDKKECYFAEIVPLKEGKAANIFVIDAAGKTDYLSVNEVSPVRAVFLRKENGYKVTFKEGTSEPVLRAPRYRKVDKATYTPPSKKVNFDILEQDFKSYEELKARVIVSTLQIGLIAAVAVQSYLSNINITSAYLLGVLGSCVYFYLLSKKIDDVGSTYSLMNDRPKNSAVNNTSAVNYRYTASLTYPNSSRQPIQQQGGVKNEELGPQADVSLAQIPLLYAQYIGQRLAKVGANARLLVPVLVLALLAGRDYFYEGYVPSKLNYIPKDEFIGAVGGFLTLRLTLFINEVGKEFKAEELIGLVPGSLAVTLRSLLFPKK